MSKQNIAVTTDCVIFCATPQGTKILLIKRKNGPFEGQWALPGGFLEDDEPLETGAKRELQEETGVIVENLRQLKTFGAPGRDPRGRTLSITYWGEIKKEERVSGSDDAADAKWFRIDDLPDMAFDHGEIVKTAIEHYLRQEN